MAKQSKFVKMADRLTPEQRSRNMASIRSKNTKPELFVRKLVFSMGYRYRLHVNSLPGKPDLVFPRYRKIIEIRGCFWHRHNCKRGLRTPASHREYWTAKIQRNVQRDHNNKIKLLAQGWKLLIIWDCETRKANKLRNRISKFLRKKEEKGRRKKGTGTF